MSVLNENVIIGASAQGGYDIPNSLRFNDDDSAYLSRTPSSAGNRKTWTWSGWVKRGGFSQQVIIGLNSASTNIVTLAFLAGDALRTFVRLSTADVLNLTTTQVFRDSSAWYHITLAIDTTQATASNRCKMFVNGEQITAFSTATYPALNADLPWNSNSYAHDIGREGTGNYLDGYLSEVNFIDGQALTPDSFGETGDYGEWLPKKYAGTYGTNGFYLDFKDSGSLGNDAAGSNNWTPTNLAATDQMLDSPTNNFAVLNPLYPSKASGSAVRGFEEGNLKGATDGTGSGWSAVGSTFTLGSGSGKWYWEVNYTIANDMCAGVHRPLINTGTFPDPIIGYTDGSDTDGFSYMANGTKQNNGPASYGDAYTSGDIIGIALNLSVAGSASITFYKNNTTQGVAFSSLTGDFLPAFSSTTTASFVANFGQDSSFAGNKTAQGNSDANGIGDFYYAPPTGFLALCTKNLPDATVVPSEHFNTVLYTGNGGTQAVTGVGFTPDFVWMKRRNAAAGHYIGDTIRGAGYQLISNNTDAEAYQRQNGYVTSYDSDGFSMTAGSSSAAETNESGSTYVAWNWKAGGTGVSNTDGTITSTVSANVDAGFSIVSYTGNATVGATVGHGLSIAPELVMSKNRIDAGSWNVWSPPIMGNGYWMPLNLTSASSLYNATWSTNATNLVLADGGGHNGAGDAMIAYAFHSVDGYSKVGSYTGNGSSSDGTFVYLGFRPAYVMIKITDGANNWFITDSARDNYNESHLALKANASSSEQTSNTELDLLSNGFKLRNTTGGYNLSGYNYIYLAFAESPFKHSNAR